MALVMIPGLHIAPKYSDLQVSSKVYNTLPDDHEQPCVSKETLDELCRLFQRHSAHHVFGIHLVHRHFQTSDNHVMLGSKLNHDWWWTRPTPISTVHDSTFHGHVYVVSLDRGLSAYEYRDGNPPKRISQIDPRFYQDFADYLIQQRLHTVLGLEVLEDSPDTRKRMLEIVIQDHSTVMMEEDDANPLETLKVTGWISTLDSDGVISFKGNEGHSQPPGGQHVIFTDGKLLQTDEEMMDFLRTRGLGSPRQLIHRQKK